ncbi:Gypsy retrotransposon integrase-like protein 1 [Trichinella patagoniensis]|uniref:RNA-directed DNA polymerase n=1 Tax=Trichinella patagoniensis TaxID=990121 RepID=A0A0V0Z8D0_9BILA|nr:Gypsy retrotransposon integrase-like protein 1 [Trichinella patagoniensis]
MISVLKLPFNLRSRLRSSLWSQRDRIVVHEGTICRKWETPDTGETRLLQVIPRQRMPEILGAIHNRQSGAHLGVAKTMAKLRQRYYWPQQREDVEHWCRACQTCAVRAVPTKKPQAAMQLYEAVREKAGREQRRQKFWKDRKAHGPVYEPGDQVWMQVPDKTKPGAYWDGPYEVQKKLDWNTYRVKEMKGRRQRLVVHFDRLKPYHGSRQPGEG